MEPFGSDTDEARARSAAWLLVVVAVAGLGASLLAMRVLRSSERADAEHRFQIQASAELGAVRREAVAVQERFDSLVALYASSGDVDDAEFEVFAERCLGPVVRAVVSVSAVVRAGDRPSLFVVRGVGSELGRLPDDLASDERYAGAFERSRESEAAVLSAPTQAGAAVTDPRSLIVAPVFSRSREPGGFVAALLDLEGLLVGCEVPVWLEDVTGGTRTQLASTGSLPGVPSTPATSGEAEVAEDLDPRLSREHELFGRRWRFTARARPGFITENSTWLPWAGFFAGIVMTIVALAATAAGAGRLRLHRLVAARTAEVKKAYGTLAEEAKERQWAVAETRELERQLTKIIDLAPGMVYVKDWFGRFLLANQATADAYGTTVDALSASRDVDLNTDVTQPDDTLRADRELIERGLPTVNPAVSFVNAEGDRRILRVIKIPCSLGQLGQVLLCIATDITDQEYADDILTSQTRILARIAAGTDAKAVLLELVHAVEEIVPDMRCSVLLLGEDRRMYHCCAPSLPDFYNKAIHGLRIGPKEGSCGAAAYSGERVVVSDISTHENWAPYREIARQSGFGACWSEPIHGKQGEVLGTFAMYYSTVREPAAHEEKLIESMAHLAGLAIQSGSLEFCHDA